MFGPSVEGHGVPVLRCRCAAVSSGHLNGRSVEGHPSPSREATCPCPSFSAAARRCPLDTCLPQKHLSELPNRPPAKRTHVERTPCRALITYDVSTWIYKLSHGTFETHKTHVV